MSSCAFCTLLRVQKTTTPGREMSGCDEKQQLSERIEMKVLKVLESMGFGVQNRDNAVLMESVDLNLMLFFKLCTVNHSLTKVVVKMNVELMGGVGKWSPMSTMNTPPKGVDG
eukprot:CAMPEP_0113844806 /NCGR_PEP_ID=MMETSP0372-20130328/426_1 /TAXON_ID=340204 /ORGANISM="Lankesteria abbotti" /LENGTH=112 /DNA_ID=CAMNT_0000813819 /DNA_START=483 /DNA_END=821 /DNA_ORIENTATION=+ /assembly_acc=CAM_ASM_000359